MFKNAGLRHRQEWRSFFDNSILLPVAITMTTTTTDSDIGNDYSGTFSVTETSSQVATDGTQTGNTISSDYTLTQSVTNTYSMTEVADNTMEEGTGDTAYTLSETGSWYGTVANNGNTIEGNYTNSTTGSDYYTMTDVGTSSGVPFNETVTGSETFTATETGNPATQIYTRDITGSGGYTITGTGITTGSSSYSYETMETADARSGVLSQSQTGVTRYGILARYNDVSNTNTGNSPGNMNFLPYGQPFVDPDPTDYRGEAAYMSDHVYRGEPFSNRNLGLSEPSNKNFGQLELCGAQSTFKDVKQVTDALKKVPAAEAELKAFEDAGGKIQSGNTFAGAAITLEQGKPIVITIDPDPRKTRNMGTVTGMLLFELMRAKFKDEKFALIDKVSKKQITVEQYAVEMEKLTYKYSQEQNKIAGPAVKDGTWGDGAAFYGQVMKMYPTFEEFLEYQKKTKHYDVFIQQGNIIKSKNSQSHVSSATNSRDTHDRFIFLVYFA